MDAELPAADCLCIFCAGVVAVCTGTSGYGVCNCGRCCDQIQASFGMTETDLRELQEDQDRIAEWAELVLSIEIELAEMDWLTLADLTNFLLGVRRSAKLED